MYLVSTPLPAVQLQVLCFSPLSYLLCARLLADGIPELDFGCGNPDGFPILLGAFNFDIFVSPLKIKRINLGDIKVKELSSFKQKFKSFHVIRAPLLLYI